MCPSALSLPPSGFFSRSFCFLHIFCAILCCYSRMLLWFKRDSVKSIERNKKKKRKYISRFPSLCSHFVLLNLAQMKFYLSQPSLNWTLSAPEAVWTVLVLWDMKGVILSQMELAWIHLRCACEWVWWGYISGYNSWEKGFPLASLPDVVVICTI